MAEEFEENDDGVDTSDDSAGASGESGREEKPPESDKRVRDLQSKFDSETARANKAEKRILALETALKGSDSEASKPSAPAGGDAGNTAILDMARMFAYQQHAKLAEFGVEMSDLSGGTPGEIARNATELLTRFEKIETQARNKVLAEQGLAPEIVSGSPTKTPRNFETMSKEDFEKVVAKALSGRP